MSSNLPLKFILTVLALASLSVARASDFDFAAVASKPHPRLMMSDGDLKLISKELSRGNPNVTVMHEALMGQTSGMKVENKQFQYVPDGMKTPLFVSREFLKCAIACSYAYRYSKDKGYVRMTEPVIEYLSANYEDWINQGPIKAPIVEAEYTLGLAIVYDWMYKDLKPEVKAILREQIDKWMLKKKWKETRGHNRSQVCNAAWFACAAAVAETLPSEEMPARLSERVEDLRETMRMIYSPDGAGNESPSYWSYGANFQAFALWVLESAYGSSFGLLDVPGFRMTLDYHAFSVGNTGVYFTYGDCNRTVSAVPSVWYYAWLFNQPGYLNAEIRLLDKGLYTYNREVILGIVPAARFGKVKTVAPSEKLYAARGSAPVIIARTGWNKEDAYLGFKGGSPKTGHAHVDEGSFIYEAYGVRWASDLPHGTYQIYRNAIKAAKRSMASVPEPTSREHPAWDIFHVSNRQHNTLTVNSHNQHPLAEAAIVEVFDTVGGKLGGALDLSAMYAGDLSSCRRTALLYPDQSLDIRDVFTVCDSTDAQVRWTLCTQVEPVIREDCIELSSKGIKIIVRTDAPGAVYQQWPCDPKAYETSTSRYEKGDEYKGFYLCGFTFTAPAGSSRDITTTFRK